jgi:HK97 family phage portal protein
VGFLDRFRRVQAVDTVGLGATGNYYGAWTLSNEAREQIMGLTPAEMWRTQPYLRTVVTFLARNIAQLGLHTFLRADENDRQRVRDGAVPRALGAPNRGTTGFELVYGLVADLALHDIAYWLITDDPDQYLTRLPVGWVSPVGGDSLGPDSYNVRLNDKGEAVNIPADQILAFHGWHPGSLSIGSSPVHALREILAEQVQAAKYRENVWKRGGKVGAVLSRPAGAPDWSPEARQQFKADWDSKFTGNGARVGGTPLLEDGMTLSRVDFSAHEMQFIEGSRLALNTVASVYHVNPTMIGLLDNANYSNVREFRRMLYGDTLGPTIAMIEDRLNAFLVPKLDTRPGLYVEFNIDEKLQGSFEEQTTAIQSAVGRPWMTTNEARALRNMPAIDGGDDLVTPLNVLVGGQASPTDSAPPKSVGPVNTKRGNLFLLKARASDRQAEKVKQVLRDFLTRQGSAVLGKVGEGDWWDAKRWDKELAADLHAVALTVTADLGKAEATALGYSAEDYTPEATVNFLQAVAERYASNINLTTKGQLDAALEAEDGDPAEVYAPAATDTRAGGVAVGVTTFLAGFATHEAASQLSDAYDLEPTKTWVTGSNPRADHAAMDGETVGLHESFSNGADWPGAGSDAADVANCNCTVLINT